MLYSSIHEDAGHDGIAALLIERHGVALCAHFDHAERFRAADLLELFQHSSSYTVKSVFPQHAEPLELGGAMTKWMVEERGYRPGKMVIVADARYGKVFYAHKGHCLIRLKAQGRGGHSARPWECDDSITRVVRGYLKVRETWDAKHPATDDKWYDSIVPTILHSEGEVMNRIPREADVILNLRSVNPGARDELLGMIRELTDCEAEVVRYSPPVNSDPDHPLVRGVLKAMREVCGKGELDRMPGATDARCFVGCNVPIAIVGTLGGNAHGDDEWADPKTFDLFGEWLARFLYNPGKYSGEAF